MSLLCLCYVSVMSLLCLCYVSVMSLLCLFYVSFMSLLCLFYVSFMSLVCLSEFVYIQVRVYTLKIIELPVFLLCVPCRGCTSVLFLHEKIIQACSGLLSIS